METTYTLIDGIGSAHFDVVLTENNEIYMASIYYIGMGYKLITADNVIFTASTIGAVMNLFMRKDETFEIV